MVTAGLERLDSFPYRHRVREVMSAPLEMALPSESLGQAASRMVAQGISSVVVEGPNGEPVGIVTERDVLRALAQMGPDAYSAPLSLLMSAGVATVEADAFVYVAMGRLARLGYRHLVVIDRTGRAIGMMTTRALLKLRSAETLQLGDQVAAADDAAGMDAARRELPVLAGHLLQEDVGAVGAAAVISAVYCDISARAAALAEAEMRADPAWGRAPASWCFLVLGSGGRGESLLAPDQDNAIVHAGYEADTPWFRELGRRAADILDASGIPYCKGGVMAREEAWCHSRLGWSDQLRRWTHSTDPQALLQVDIFYDFAAVHGDSALASDLRAEATEAARGAPEFLRRMAASQADFKPPLGLFGGFVKRDGRVDLKLGGLLPLVSGARVLALKLGVTATATRDRLNASVDGGRLKETDVQTLAEAQETLMRAVLDQQIDDLDKSIEPSVRVDPGRWTEARANRVKQALRRIEELRLLVNDALSASG